MANKKIQKTIKEGNLFGKRKFDREILFKITLLFKLFVLLLVLEVIDEFEEIYFFGHNLTRITIMGAMIVITIILGVIIYSLMKYIKRNF
ncbi:MAG TPA: hypothetical protein VJ343_00865 [archaeon]|nr:hypothetical protein [archaeon]